MGTGKGRNIHERGETLDFMMFLLAITRVAIAGQLVVNLVEKISKHV